MRRGPSPISKRIRIINNKFRELWDKNLLKYNLTGVQIVEHHLACAIQDSDLDSRIILVERLKARNQIGLRDRIACADDEFTREQLARLRKLFFAALDEAQTVRNIVKEKLSLTGQDDTARAAREQPNLQLLFQLLDGLADCRL